MLTEDIISTNGKNFMIPPVRKIIFFTVENIPIRTAGHLTKGLNKVIKLCGRGGLIIHTIFMDMNFEKMADMLVKIEARITAAREHVGEVERKIRTAKVCGRLIINALPHYCLSTKINIHLVSFLIMWLNALPSGNGISQKYSPREIVTELNLGFKKNCKVGFGSYVESHYEPNITNNVNIMTPGCIGLIPTVNIKVTQKVFCLKSGGVLKRRNLIPMIEPYQIINKFNYWCKKPKIERYENT